MNSDRNKRIRKHSSCIKSAPKIEPHSYYHSDNNKRLKEINALDVRHNGITYGTVIDTLQDTRLQLEEVKALVKGAEASLTTFLLENRYNTPNTEINALIVDLNELTIVNNEKEFIGFSFDKDGYVNGLGYEVIFEKKDYPEDFDKGYWKVDKKGVWTLDNKRMNELWGVL